MTEHWAYSMWYNAGFRGNFAKDWRVNKLDESHLYAYRALEVKEYLEEHPADDFIIFDDSDYNYNDTLGVKRFIKTDSNEGMLFKHMKDAWSIMGTWDKK